jgi:O-antigen/teichoic acid export membrane protein
MQWRSWSMGILRGSNGTQTALALGDQLIVSASNFLALLLVGRLAGPKELGVFSLVFTVYYLLLAVQESLITVPYTILGVQFKGTRHRQYSGASLCQSVVWSAFIGVILAIVALALSLHSGETNLGGVVAAFALALPLWLLREFGRRYLFAQMQVAKVVVISVVGGIAQLAMLGMLAYFGRLSAATALLAMGVSSGIAGLGWLWLSRAAFRFNRRRWSYFALKNWLFGRWLLVCQAMSILAQSTMPWFVLIWLGPTATGLFAACQTIIRFANPIIVSQLNVLTPRLALGFKDGSKVELNRIVWKATALLTLVLVAFCVVLAVAGEWFLTGSFGKIYAGCSATILVLGINQVVGSFGIPHGGALWVLQRVNINLLAHGVNLAVSLLVAPFLLSHYASLGAALALLIGSLAYSAVTVGFYLVEIREGKDESFIAIGQAMTTAASIGSVSE